MPSSIAELLAEQGRVLADARRRSGERRGMFVSSLGQIPGQIMADRRAEQIARIQQAQAVAQGIRQTRTDARLDAAEDRAQAVFDASRQEEYKKTAALEAQKVAAQGYHDVPGWIASGTRRGLWSPEEGAQMLQQAQDPAGAKRLVDFIAPLADPKDAPRLIQRDPTRDLVNEQTGAVVTPGVPEPLKATPVQFLAPQPVMVGGKRILARAGSDGFMYDMRGQKLPEVSPDMPPTTAAQGPQPGWQWVERSGTPVHTNRPLPGDKPLREPSDPGGAKMPALMAGTVAASQTSLAALDTLEGLYRDEMVGPWAGRYNKGERAAPAPLGAILPDAPQGFEDFAAETATLKNQVIQAITGAAVGVQEQSRIMNQIPDVTDSPANWRAKAKATRRNLKELIANQIRMGTGAAVTPVAPGTTVTLPPRNDEPREGVETAAQRAKRLYDELSR